VVELRYVVGVDIGATNMRAALADEKGIILKDVKQRTIIGKSAESITRQVVELIKRVVGEKAGKLKAVGIGSIGPLDFRRGKLISPANIPFKEIEIARPVAEEFKVPVYMLNDCTAAALGEKAFGTARNRENFVYITLSTGIGGGAVVDGHLLIGKDGNAVEIGHMVVDFEGRLKCGCGRRGHWEAYCSGRNIPRFVEYWIEKRRKRAEGSMLIKMIKDKKLSSESLFKAARMGDKLAMEVVDEVGRLNAIGFANVVSVYDPELITVGGGMALDNWDLISRPILRDIGRYTINRVPEIRLTDLGEKAVLYGAVALALKPPGLMRGDRWACSRPYKDLAT